MIVTRHFGPVGSSAGTGSGTVGHMVPAPDWNGVPLVTERLPGLLGTDRTFAATHTGAGVCWVV